MTEKKKGQYRRFFSYLVQGVVIALLVWYLFQNRSVFSALSNIRLHQVLWVILLELASFLVGSYLNYSMIRRFDPRVSFMECFHLQYVNNLLNKILPTIGGGAAFRAIYLKKVYQFPYSQFTATVAGLYVISFTSTSLIGILCLVIIYSRIGVFNWVVFLAFLGIFLVNLFIILFSPQIPESQNRILRILRNVVQGWMILKKDSKYILIFTLLSTLLLFLLALQTVIVYLTIGVQTSLIPMLFLATLGIILAFINFTPDGIGIKEGIFIFSKDLVQIPDGILVLGSVTLRGISIFTTFTIGGFSYWFLMRRLKLLNNKVTEPIEISGENQKAQPEAMDEDTRFETNL